MYEYFLKALCLAVIIERKQGFDTHYFPHMPRPFHSTDALVCVLQYSVHWPWPVTNGMYVAITEGLVWSN